MKKNRFLALATVFTALAFTFSGCSSENNGNNSTEGGGGDDSSSSNSVSSSSGTNSGGSSGSTVVTGTLSDTRDSKSYKTVTIGGKTCMAKNLNYETNSGSVCYSTTTANCTQYGRLYYWETAKNACPSGWRLPNDDDWEALMIAVGGAKNPIGSYDNAGEALKAKSSWVNSGYGLDTYQFAALPGGMAVNSGGNFSEIGERGYWWSVSETNASSASLWSMSYLSKNVSTGNTNKNYSLSVRCVKND
jgi:uncharacterized protein (TIGR02145 family)